MMDVHNKPCSGCPYRRDCPSGVWAASEYQKLADYDKETGDQPTGVFLCHDGDRENTVCRGWLDTHDKHHLLALRLAVSMGLAAPEIMDLPKSDVPCFNSGREAQEHGLAKLKRPSREATVMQQKLKRRHPELKYETTMESTEVLDRIHQMMTAHRDNPQNMGGEELVENISYDGDSNSGEIIFDTVDDDGTKQTWVLSSAAIRELDPDDEEE